MATTKRGRVDEECTPPDGRGVGEGWSSSAGSFSVQEQQKGPDNKANQALSMAHRMKGITSLLHHSNTQPQGRKHTCVLVRAGKRTGRNEDASNEVGAMWPPLGGHFFSGRFVRVSAHTLDLASRTFDRRHVLLQQKRPPNDNESVTSHVSSKGKRGPRLAYPRPVGASCARHA